MTRPSGGGLVRRACSWVVRRARHRLDPRGDGGFMLLESLIAITVITIVMSAVGAEFVSGVAATSRQRAQQTAVQLADSAVEQIRALHPSDLLSGRDLTSVTTQREAAPAALEPWLAGMEQASDGADSLVQGVSGLTAAVPTAGVTRTPGATTPGSGGVTYTVSTYLGRCWIPTSGSQSCTTRSTQARQAGTPYLRAVVAVSWPMRQCGTDPCVFVTSTLVSAVPDPTFQVNEVAHSTPVIVAPGARTSIAGDPASLQLTVKEGTGVPAYTWAVTDGALPTGLSLSPTGLISGTVQGPPGTYTATVQVTDAFVRTDTATITWTVDPGLALTVPAAQAALRGPPITSLTLSATGGSASGYTYRILDSSLPPGLSLSGDTVSGTPTTVGDYTVRAQVTDSAGRTDTQSFTWSVADPPLAATNPGDQIATVSTAIRPLQLSASGGNGSYVWSDPTQTLPAGLSLDAGTGRVTGTISAATPTSTTVSLTVSDPSAGPGFTSTVSFVWKIVAKPSITGPGNQTVSIGQPVDLTLPTSCDNGPCTFAIQDGPTGLSIDAAGRVSGTVGGPARTFANVTLKATDRDGASTTSDPFALTVVPAPTVVGADQTSTLGGAVDVALTTTCSSAPCTYTLHDAPEGLSVSGAGHVTGTVGGTVRDYPRVTVTVTDSGGSTATSNAFTWTVLAPPSLGGVSDQSVGVSSTSSIPLEYSCPAAPCTVTLSGGLADSAIGLGLSTSRLQTTRNTATSVTVPSGSRLFVNGVADPDPLARRASTAYGVTLTITDRFGVSGTAGSTATYTTHRTPTVSTPHDVSTSRDASPSETVAYSCPDTSCTVTVTGLPPGVGLSTVAESTASTNASQSVGATTTGSLLLTGRVDPAADQRRYLVRVQITSSDATITSTDFWTVS